MKSTFKTIVQSIVLCAFSSLGVEYVLCMCTFCVVIS